MGSKVPVIVRESKGTAKNWLLFLEYPQLSEGYKQTAQSLAIRTDLSLGSK